MFSVYKIDKRIKNDNNKENHKLFVCRMTQLFVWSADNGYESGSLAVNFDVCKCAYITRYFYFKIGGVLKKSLIEVIKEKEHLCNL